MKRFNKSKSLYPVKKQKTEKIKLKNYSNCLKQNFYYKDLSFTAYLHKFRNACSFGLVLPLKYPKNMSIEYLRELEIQQDFLDTLRKFQNKIWHDLKQEKMSNSCGQLSEANYLVVPMLDESIDVEKIKKCLNGYSENCENIEKAKRPNYIWVNTKGNSIVKYVSEVPDNVFFFFKTLIGEKHPNFQTFIEKYKSSPVIDVILTGKTRIHSLEKFSYKENDVKIGQLVFVKHARSVIYNPSLYSKQEYFEKGTPIILASQLVTFYFTKLEYSQLFEVVDSLIKVEHLSNAIDFSSKINYCGSIDILRNAMTSSSADKENNYESLETIGDTILKFIVSLSLYLEDSNQSESCLTDKRSELVSNKTLSNISKKLDFHVYIKTLFPPHSKFIPAYYTNPKITSLNSFETEQLITDSILADFIEALIGAFYIGESLISAVRFIENLGLIQNFELIKKYIPKYKIAFYCSSKTWMMRTNFFEFFQEKKMIFKENRIEIGRFQYQLKSQSLSQALTHFTVDQSSNYEKLEYLGDAVLDFLIVSNLYAYGKFDPYTLSTLKQLLVCNQHLCCISLATNIPPHIQSKSLPKQPFSQTPNPLKISLITDDIFKLDLNKQFGDIIESLLALVLIDSSSLYEASQLAYELFGEQLSQTLRFHKEYIYFSSISSRLKKPEPSSTLKQIKKI